MKIRILVLMLLVSVCPVFAAQSVPLPRLVDLGATKCIPCKQMVPVLAALKSEYAGQLEVVFLDVWENSAAGKPYGIRLIPTQVFFDAAGKELYRHEGYWSKAAIVAKFKELGVTLTPPPVSKDGKAP
ncbi:MAG: thioredoxin family protein [Opitutales bacterium]|nr:thioredoxin family protein [Opitutales bacterium]